MKVKDIMRTEYLSLQRDDRLEFILKTFAKNFISSAPVLDEDEFIGIISIHDIMRFFNPRQRFLLLMQKDAAVPPIPELKRVIAAEIAAKPRVVLNPDQPLKDVVKTVVGMSDCIPVFDKNKRLVGIVRSEDLSLYFLRRLTSYEEEEKEFYDISKGERRVSTDIDRVLAIVQRNDWTPVRKIAKELGLSVKTAEKLGEVLRDHHLIRMKYTFFGGAELGRVEKERAAPAKALRKGREGAKK